MVACPHAQVLCTLVSGSYIRSLAYDPQSQLLASVSADGCLRVWEIAERKLLHTLRGAAPRVWLLPGTWPVLSKLHIAILCAHGSAINQGWMQSSDPCGQASTVSHMATLRVVDCRFSSAHARQQRYSCLTWQARFWGPDMRHCIWVHADRGRADADSADGSMAADAGGVAGSARA